MTGLCFKLKKETSCNKLLELSLAVMAKQKIKTVLVDLSGTIHIEDEEIPGSINAVKKLQNSGLNQLEN
ncbi:hypothetical protein KUTeg_017088 [Tegillarca granosa]|uniref:Uncharacterized protein n=1 Tax=Tegillarca granosa TaxID=220873 RepID=A0ABQ9EMQ9_TEGGR|nr:hypothetical protein KUTeg_017088 [Tegillarca granosa]